MNDILIEQLLNEDESATLDFKRDQYLFSGASDDQKSELLKDILAFANSWRRTDAYILIGVEEVRGGLSIVHGVSTHIADNQLQQFVNSKTQRPITFSYKVYPFNNVQLGVIEIPLQTRPLFLKQDYGKLKKNAVYIRRGSSTAEADLEEISKMGIPQFESLQAIPELELEFCETNIQQSLGGSLKLISTCLLYDSQEVTPITVPNVIYMFDKDPMYPVKMAKYLDLTSLLSPVRLCVKNPSSTLASNVHVEIKLPKSEFLVCDKSSYPRKPSKRLYDVAASMPAAMAIYTQVEIGVSDWILSIKFGNVKPGATVFGLESFFIGAKNTCTRKLHEILYADNLPTPLETELLIDIELVEKEFNIDVLYS